VRQAGSAAAAALCGSADPVMTIVRRAYLRPPAPPEPGQGRLTGMRAARKHLSGST